jgi:hypothetical protein
MWPYLVIFLMFAILLWKANDTRLGAARLMKDVAGEVVETHRYGKNSKSSTSFYGHLRGV